MTAQIDPNNKGLKVNDHILGYRIQNIVELKEINGFLYRLVHLATGARHLHISTPDKENTFGVTFKTVPTDSTGVAHILEHTVLCGSKKYPVRDPFFSMLKRSLSTFMNAFTASDWTMYPFSTQNSKDYYNLMSVYLDAAFFPNLEELSFKQEGHRLEIEPRSKDSKDLGLVFKGVVYNEMKGAMSSPDQVMGRSILNALYPETTYSNNSGGDPAVIPQLTHDQLKAFHQRHYHPSNAFFYTYGNLGLKDQLAFIDQKIMAHFEAIDPQTDVPSQSRWSAPKSVRYTYPLAPNEDPTSKYQVCLAWLTCDIRDTFEVLVLTVLEQILLGNAASPLRKALMDANMGSALSDASGYDADNRDTLFACGLKETTEASAEAIEKIIFDVLEQLTNDGIDPELVDSAIHQIEFHRKEISNTPYPYGLKLMLTTISSWLHGGDPERILQLDADLQRLQDEIAAGPFLENRIRSYFIDNPHRIRMVLAPDQQKAQNDEAQEQEVLETRWSKLSQDDCDRINQDADRLNTLQESQENISCLPTLELSDIPPDIPSYAPTRIESKIPLWQYTQPTSGIFYLSAAAGASVSHELLPWMPFFCYAFTKVGTKKHDYTQMARRIDAATGGLTLGAHARTPWNQSHVCLPLISLNAKCLGRNIDPMLAIMEELIAETDFNNHARLKQLLGEYQAGLDAMIVQNGHRLAISLASRGFSPTAALSEIWGGIHQVRTIRAFCKDRSEKRIKALAKDLSTIGQAVFKPDNLIMAVIGEPEHMDPTVAKMRSAKVISTFKRPYRKPDLPLMDLEIGDTIPYEGWSTSSAVAFVAQTLPTAPLGHADAPVLAVLSKLLRSLYLHREIREKGGAYGGFALYNPENGLFSLASYRDPHIVRTLEVFGAVADFGRTDRLTKEDVKEAVLQVCSEIDKPDPPGPAARKAFSRLIVGLTDETRREFKQQLLQVTQDQLLAVVEKYFQPGRTETGTAIIAGEEHLQKANTQLVKNPFKLDRI